MKIIKQSHKVLGWPNRAILEIEEAARTCYQSHEKTCPGSAERLVQNLIERKHGAMLEFADVRVKFITNRGVSHELVRHRLCSFAQESTRYVKYDGGMEVIKPVWLDDSTSEQKGIWKASMEMAERTYRALMMQGWKAQQAREVLPNSLKTEIVVKANLREWRHIFSLRCAKTAHPQMSSLMIPVLNDFKKKIPIVFDDLKYPNPNSQ
jgi:thymidylate synthase (FAD)